MAADMTTDKIQAVDAFLRAELLPHLAIPDFRITPTTGIQDGMVLRPERLADGTIDLLIDVAAHHK
ncbi:hypothetical protein CKO28_00730 [Rhodovibrio sodomensis]|uniref:Uncharacterized protein n=1 Tax=Rhodovibrio sodomensis TaxID=1088 RepID=A0ABS1D9B5_9PROT|nr:hypothetical protein [Rhodovibrio sodomensis]MBK1666566.1 hypothetical protein [Rhodovibrio sodomensis]